MLSQNLDYACLCPVFLLAVLSGFSLMMYVPFEGSALVPSTLPDSVFSLNKVTRVVLRPMYRSTLRMLLRGTWLSCRGVQRLGTVGAIGSVPGFIHTYIH